MIFRCDGFALSEAVLKVIKATPIKKNNSLLEGIKIVAEDGFVTLTATDNELTIIKKIVADVRINGQVLVLGRVFSDYLKSIGQVEIEFECTDGKNINIKYGENNVLIKCMDVSAYPNIDEVITDVSLDITKDDLKDLISKTVFAASTEEARAALKGCFFDINDKELYVVALDGYRLALVKKTLVNSNANKTNYLIPARSLIEIQKFIDEAEDNITLEFNKDKLYVNINNSIIITRLLLEKYPSYKAFIDSGFTTNAVFNKTEFFDSIKRASIMTKEGKNSQVKLDFKEGYIFIESNGDMGDVHEKVKATIEGRDTVVCFNSRYLIDFLSVIDDEFIKINIKTNISPCIFTQVTGDDFLFLVLPMKINF